ALHVSRNVSHARCSPRARTRPTRRPELPPLELADGDVKRPVQYPRQIPRGDLMAQQCLEVSQLVVRGLVEGDPEREPLGRERRDLGWLGLNAPRGAFINRPEAIR